MLEPSHAGPTESSSEPDGRVVEFVRDDQTTLSDQCWDGSRVGCETHGSDHCRFGAGESSDQLFGLDVQVCGRGIVTGPSTGNTISSDRSFGGIGASTGGGCESEVVVRRDVQCSCGSASQRERVVFVDGSSIEADDRTTSDTSDGSSKTFV